jgi:hypothetical protein
MTCLPMAAQFHDYILSKLDVKLAYLQNKMTETPVFMKLVRKLTPLVISILPELQCFVTPKGKLYTRLLKALYGCI